MKKINVVGTSGSGKSTFSKALAEILHYPYIEMDAIFWKPDWEESSDEVFFHKLKKALQEEYWVLDGNYSRTTSIKWKEVDTVIWLDFNFVRTLYQAIKRAINRAITQKELWPGTNNRESFKKLFSRDSIVLWTITTYWGKKSRYLSMMKDSKYQHINFVRLRTPRDCEKYLDKVRLNTR